MDEGEVLDRRMSVQCGQKPGAMWVGCDRPYGHDSAPLFGCHVITRDGATYLWHGNATDPLRIAPAIKRTTNA